jgi:N-carbamoylputrescine amidase
MMKSNQIKVGVVQMSMSDDTAANVAKAIRMTREAAEKGAEVICLPELFRSPYFCKTETVKHFALAESIPDGDTTRQFEALAQELDVVIIASLFEKRATGLYHNTVAMLDGKRGFIGKYRKMHIPDDPLFYEKFYFTPGDLGFKVFDTSRGKLGTLICWDQWYPEAARLTAMQGADILFYPTAIGWLPDEKDEFGASQHNAWETIQRSHAIANGCFVVSVNRTGYEVVPEDETPEIAQGIEFWGQSFIAAPNGEILAKASADEETILVATLDLSKMAEVRNIWPFLRDRRIDAYSDLTKRYID